MTEMSAVIAAALKQLCKCLPVSRLPQSSWEDKHDLCTGFALSHAHLQSNARCLLNGLSGTRVLKWISKWGIVISFFRNFDNVNLHANVLHPHNLCLTGPVSTCRYLPSAQIGNWSVIVSLGLFSFCACWHIFWSQLWQAYPSLKSCCVLLQSDPCHLLLAKQSWLQCWFLVSLEDTWRKRGGMLRNHSNQKG